MKGVRREEPDGGAGVVDGFDGVLDLVEPTFGREGRDVGVVAARHRGGGDSAGRPLRRARGAGASTNQPAVHSYKKDNAQSWSQALYKLV